MAGGQENFLVFL